MGDLTRQCMSPFEALPKELFWEILEYIPPESVLKLRLISRLFKSRISTYSIRTNYVPTILQLHLRSEKQDNKSNDSAFVVVIEISKDERRQFEERLLLSNPPTGLTEKKGLKGHTASGAYITSFNLQAEDKEDIEYLRSCLGEKIGSVLLTNCNDKGTLNAVTEFVDGIQFESLELSGNSMSSDAICHLFATVKSHNVHLLRISARQIPAPAETLLELASLVHSIQIYQAAKNRRKLHANEGEKSILLGLENFDWAPTFIGMLSRKLDTLYIRNLPYERYLSRESADDLIEHLPKLGKEIYFKSTCKQFDSALDCEQNGYSIHADASREVNSYLIIKSSSNLYIERVNY
ncbi:hypothetical protein PMAYCL1PPCAC_20089 [Pristionchus mayeri]|uniref:F-box domain-containing protein n=1 Tax=Pristionchus mayeri TaxID=1317129 RepID=A0AAN5CSQ8_9BILA|nr:hypothetical protein PMAYCL1PPCAC_20089 [Pristionchus mayeri]